MEEDLMTSVSEDSSTSSSQDGGVIPTLIQDGTTSVALDVDTLTSAAGLTLAGADGAVESIPADFGVGFDITEESTFVVDQNTGAPIPVGADPSDGTPLFGEIEHTGTVTFTTSADTSEAADITVGDFTIGFDPARVTPSDDALDMDTPQPSGFFVANGVEGALDGAILFDVSISDLESVQITDTGLSVGSADLLVSEEFATVLGDAGLIGADVGDTTVQAIFGSPVV